MQLVRGYGPLEAGVRTIPVALSIAIASGLAPKIVEATGTKRIVVVGLSLMAIGFLWVSTDTASTPYWAIAGQMMVLGAGLGFTSAPATESIMGSLPKDKAGVGSAVNDTTRELGGTLGEGLYAVGVDALEHTAGVGREADAHDGTDVAIGHRGERALLHDADRLQHL